MASVFSEIDRRINKSSLFWHQSETNPMLDIDQNKLYEGLLRIPIPNSLWKERKFVLTKSSIYYFEEGGNLSQLRSCISWKRVESFFEQNSDEMRYGFRIFQNRSSQDFYTKNTEELDVWLGILSKVCVMSDLEDNYEIIKELGKGKYATVVLAKDLDTNEEVAIKSISKELIKESSRGVGGVVNEIDIMRKINHPNIIGLQKVFESESHVHLILDYVPGGDLFQRILEKGPFSLKMAEKFIKNLLGVLDYIHSMNIIHRDIKPENIIMRTHENDFDFKLSDFGLACESTEPQTLRCGSLGYVAPEILRKEAYTKKVDIFSAGIILFIILTGQDPFPSKDPNEKLKRNKKGVLYFQEKYWKAIPKIPIDLLRKLTENDVEARYNAKQGLQHPWLNPNRNLFENDESIFQKKIPERLSFGDSSKKEFKRPSSVAPDLKGEYFKIRIKQGKHFTVQQSHCVSRRNSPQKLREAVLGNSGYDHRASKKQIGISNALL